MTETAFQLAIWGAGGTAAAGQADARRRSATRQRAAPSPSPSLPSGYPEMTEQATSAVKRAMAAGHRRTEVQFPPLARMDTAALNQVLDANREFARVFARAFAAPLGGALRIAMPDQGEARLARESWGETTFSVSAVAQGADAQRDKMVVCVNPGGFNVNEWMHIERCDASEDMSIVLLNAELDKVRSGYYPRLFYPKLFKFNARYLSQFETAYYIRPFYAGGTLFRCFPDEWQTLARNDAGALELIHSTPSRPSLADTERRLRAHTGR